MSHNELAPPHPSFRSSVCPAAIIVSFEIGSRRVAAECDEWRFLSHGEAGVARPEIPRYAGLDDCLRTDKVSQVGLMCNGPSYMCRKVFNFLATRRYWLPPNYIIVAEI